MYTIRNIEALGRGDTPAVLLRIDEACTVADLIPHTRELSNGVGLLVTGCAGDWTAMLQWLSSVCGFIAVRTGDGYEVQSSRHPHHPVGTRFRGYCTTP